MSVPILRLSVLRPTPKPMLGIEPSPLRYECSAPPFALHRHRVGSIARPANLCEILRYRQRAKPSRGIEPRTLPYQGSMLPLALRGHISGASLYRRGFAHRTGTATFKNPTPFKDPQAHKTGQEPGRLGRRQRWSHVRAESGRQDSNLRSLGSDPSDLPD